MASFSDRLSVLEEGVRRGDPVAEVELREKFEQCLPFVVGRTLRTGRTAGPLARLIHSTARRLRNSGLAPADDHEFAGLIASCVTETWVNGLQYQ